jgi:hypothetical protein
MVRFSCAFLLAVCWACGSEEPAATGEPVVARWDINEDENLAVPVCGKCGDVLDRTKTACPKCDTPFKIEPKTIDCPECTGSKQCIHCGDAAACVACDRTGHCVLCEGTGKLDGNACPDCQGSKKCAACAATGGAVKCERCAATRTCSNCDGKGKITLR